ncbi:MAG: small multi-drug export protein [Bacteroidetes bacterium]|nr:small multi-drug export protein [Bacteroidota bacterium]
MLKELIYTFLLSISPLGEARTGIPYAVLNDVPIFLALLIGLVSNLLIFPVMMWLIDTFNVKLWPYRSYRKGVVNLARRAKNSVGVHNKKYGFWGLMIFVMIPLPGTGAYIGTIAAHVLKIDRKKAFLAISTGIIISSILMAVGSYYGNRGLDLL